jgi:hypothetical protein
MRIGEIEYGRQETGRNINFGRIIDRNVFSNTNAMFSKTANTTECRMTSNISCIQVKFSTAVLKPEVDLPSFVLHTDMRSPTRVPCF